MGVSTVVVVGWLVKKWREGGDRELAFHLEAERSITGCIVCATRFLFLFLFLFFFFFFFFSFLFFSFSFIFFYFFFLFFSFFFLFCFLDFPQPHFS